MKPVVELGLVRKWVHASPVHSNYPVNWPLMLLQLEQFGFNPLYPRVRCVDPQRKGEPQAVAAHGTLRRSHAQVEGPSRPRIDPLNELSQAARSGPPHHAPPRRLRSSTDLRSPVDAGRCRRFRPDNPGIACVAGACDARRRGVPIQSCGRRSLAADNLGGASGCSGTHGAWAGRTRAASGCSHGDSRAHEHSLGDSANGFARSWRSRRQHRSDLSRRTTSSDPARSQPDWAVCALWCDLCAAGQ